MIFFFELWSYCCFYINLGTKKTYPPKKIGVLYVDNPNNCHCYDRTKKMYCHSAHAFLYFATKKGLQRCRQSYNPTRIK